MNGDQQLVTPQLVAGRYLLLSWLGEGGMGSVYQARDIRLDELVALKLLRQDWIADAAALDRFLREVKLARRISHPNVVRTFDIGDHEGVPFLTMEYVAGKPLASSIGRGGFSLRRVVEIGTALCDGLAAAHALGIIHRDLKPDNVLVTDSGRVAISDFGLAWTREGYRADSITGSGSGTPGYMSPEQALGLVVDARADVYSLGAILYELLTGSPAWDGPNAAAVAVAQATHPPPDPTVHRPDVPAVLAEAVLGCLARDPDRRIASAEQVRQMLTGVSLPHETPTPRTPAKTPKRSDSPPPVETPRRRVAVLPLRNASSSDDALLVDGMTDDLIDELSMTDGLQVRPRSAVMRFAETDLDPRDLGRVLEVDAVVAGSMRREGEQLSLGIRLLSVSDGFQVWARRFEYAPASLLSAAQIIAAEIARALSVRWEASAPPVPEHQEVVELLLRARKELREFWLDHARKAEEMLVRALELAPDAPVILAALALARQRLWLHLGGAAARTAAMDSAARAVAAAPRLPQAWLAHGLVRIDSGEVVEGVNALRVAVELGRGVAEAHEALGKILIQVGAIAHGIHRLNTAAKLDPDLAPLALLEIARVQALSGDVAASEATLSTAERNATVPQRRMCDFIRARTALWLGGDRAVVSRFACDMVGDANHLAIRAAFADVMRGALSSSTVSYFRGMLDDAERTLRIRLFFGQMLVEAAAATGDRELALDTLLSVSSAGLIDRVWLDRCPLLAPLVGDTRFAAARTRTHALADKVAAAHRLKAYPS